MARPGDEVAAGDGLVAFGAALILPVQMHFLAGKAAAGQWICTKRGHSRRGPKADKQDRQIQHRIDPLAAQPRVETWAAPQPLAASSCSTTAAAGEQLPATPTPAPERRAAVADRSPGVSVDTGGTTCNSSSAQGRKDQSGSVPSLRIAR